MNVSPHQTGVEIFYKENWDFAENIAQNPDIHLVGCSENADFCRLFMLFMGLYAMVM